MTSANDGASSAPRKSAAKPKKKAPNHFKAGGNSLVAGLLAGADQVAERSFLGGANRESEAPTRLRPTPAPPPPATPPSPTKPSGTSETSRTTGASGTTAATGSVPSQGSEAPAAAPTALEIDDPGTQARIEAVPAASAIAAVGEPPAARKPEAPAPVTAATLTAPLAAPKAPRRTPAPDPRPEREPEPEPVAAAEPVQREASVAGDEASAQRRRPRTGKSWAHAAVHESFANAKIRSETWTSYGFRIDPEVLADLKERLKADRRTSGNTMLGQGHYMDAALRHIPEDVEAQIEMAQAFLDDRMGVVGAGRQSTFRVGPVAYALISTLNQGLQEADYGRRGLYVISAALENFLQALDAEGELQRPERRARVQRPMP
ncbi:hypothetical protein [Streptomyces sp. SDr-06]|uniref:hypothetical protein n=1 Tax=Streptomyces sp. SDr-06 TaxID=2267702 RepID=UPI001CB93298|nr:hypothetical protein [Streptomyces sp. SDr-06]